VILHEVDVAEVRHTSRNGREGVDGEEESQEGVGGGVGGGRHAAPRIEEAWQMRAALEGGGGAVLVRPDGYVAWRHCGGVGELVPSAPSLVHLARILGCV